MIVDKNNYEEYVVSSLEGMLTTEEQAALDTFLNEHPALKKEVDAYKRVFLVPDETITYPGKSLLLKSDSSQDTILPYKGHSVRINTLNYEEYIVVGLEGKLTNEQQAGLDAFLYKHPELKADVDAYKLAFLVPDETVVFPDKELLLKPEPVVRFITPFYRRYSVWLSIAACLLVLVMCRVFLYNNGEIDSPININQSAGQGYASAVNTSLPGRDVQDDFSSLNGNPHEVRMINSPAHLTYQTQHTNRQTNGLISEVSTIPVRNAVYIPQQQNRHISALQSNSSEQARIVAEHLLAQRNQSALISNAANIGKTLWHLSGRQLPNEAETGQQFRVVQVSYDSKDVSFVRIVH